MDPLQIPGVLEYHNIDPELFRWGFIVIRWYSLAYIGGLMLGWWYLGKLTTLKKSPTTKLQIDDFIMWATLGIILGGRLGYVLFYNPVFYFNNPGDILQVWDGGMSFHGGFLGVVLATIMFCRKQNINLLGFADQIAIVSPMGLFFGRIANFINGELWGGESDLPWAMQFPTGGDVYRHPSQIYEALGEGLILFIILNWLYHKTDAKKHPGIITGVFFIGYGFARYLVEFVREPDAHLGRFGDIITMGQILSLPMLIVGMGFILYATRKKKKG